MKLIMPLLAATFICTSPTMFAAPPDPNVPNPPLQVLEHNVDESGWIAVHEQGTASVDIIDTEELDVNVTNETLDVSGSEVKAEVTNFPEEQAVYIVDGRLSSVNEVWAGVVKIDDDGNEVVDFGRTIDTTHISVSIPDQEGPDGDSEFILQFYSPLVPGGFGGQPVLRMIDLSSDLLYETMTFSYPVPLDGFRFVCANESEDCEIAITVFGFTGE